MGSSVGSQFRQSGRGLVFSLSGLNSLRFVFVFKEKTNWLQLQFVLV